MKALSLALLLASTAASAALHRVAMIVGANRGALGRPDLRYSYLDAQSVADTLIQVGEFKPADVHVLHDPSPEVVLATLDGELAALGASRSESLLVFYYSGHADGAALYPAGQPLLFSDLRGRLESSAATVRLGIIDACNGGGWTGAKGLHAAPPFPVQVPLELAGEGSILIASSSGLEAAHESEGLLGSYFTHHLVAGLRGAADPRGDGIVTVTDAFAYAKERTVRDTAAVSREPQHPSFFMNLRGRADLPLARVDTSPTLVELQEMEGPLQLIHLGTGLVVLEVPSGRRALKLSVPAGRYLLRRERRQGTEAHEITVEPGRSIQVREEELLLTGLAARNSKGAAESGSPADAWPLSLNGRPLTLSTRLVQFDVGLPFTLVFRGPGGSTPYYALAPGIRYGLTDRATLSGGGTCLGSSWCTRYSTRFGGELTFGILSAGPVDFAATVGVAYDGQPGDPLYAGTVARVQGGPLAIVLVPQIQYRMSAADGFHWAYVLAGQLVLQATERLAFDLGTVLHASFAEPNPFKSAVFQQGGIIPMTIGATWVLGRRFDLRAQFTVAKLLASAVSPPSDIYTLGFYASLRP